VLGACVLLIGALLAGESWFGLGLGWASAAAFILVFAHQWRKLKSFSRLFWVSAIGIPLFIVLHNLLYALEQLSKDIVALPVVLEYLHAGCFLAASFVCPAGVLVAAIGALMWGKN
jgi:hypothetical protein